MSMTKKDYEVIAKVFAEFRGNADRTGERTGLTDVYIIEKAAHATLASELAIALRQTNHRFDPQRFIDACGVK